MVAPVFEVQPRALGASAARLTRTPQGWQVFEAVFIAAMDPALRSIVQTHISKDQQQPTNDEQAAAYDTVYNALIQRIESDLDLIALAVGKGTHVNMPGGCYH